MFAPVDTPATLPSSSTCTNGTLHKSVKRRLTRIIVILIYGLRIIGLFEQQHEEKSSLFVSGRDGDRHYLGSWLYFANSNQPTSREHKCFVNDCVNYGNLKFISGQNGSSKRHAVT
jgi:hypothetical protein